MIALRFAQRSYMFPCSLSNALAGLQRPRFVVFPPVWVRAAGLGCLCCGFAGLRPAAAQLPPDERTPIILVGAFIGTPTVLGFQVADSVRAQLRRLVPQHELYVVSKSTIQGVLDHETPPVWTIEDVRELAKQVRASVILEVGPSQLTNRVHLEPLLIRGRNEPEHFDPIDAATVGGAARLLARRIAADSSLRRSHTQSPPRKPANER